LLARGYPLNAVLVSFAALLVAAVRPQTPLTKAIMPLLVAYNEPRSIAL
jgi:hypothetical protein